MNLLGWMFSPGENILGTFCMKWLGVCCVPCGVAYGGIVWGGGGCGCALGNQCRIVPLCNTRWGSEPGAAKNFHCCHLEARANNLNAALVLTTETQNVKIHMLNRGKVSLQKTQQTKHSK